MFTGIIEAVGEIRKIQPSGGRIVLGIDLKHLAADAHPGDSIAVNGVCLTISHLEQSIASFDVSSETVHRSTLLKLRVGSKANLERALSAQGRFGGHFVQGHVDGTGKIVVIRRETGFAEFRFEAKPELMSQIILKGSIAIDGISLTVSELNKSGFGVSLIPSTLSQTIWQDAKVGDLVNIETDILVKIVQKQLGAMWPGGCGLTAEKIRDFEY
ncbi:MAG: riboflavin synthase [Planctomycetaceae bacterium]|nr:riboflavin synthase [Planctomycetaceae bacterium]